LEYNFEWDMRKSRTNIIKHRVYFEISATVFKDPRALTIYDVTHSSNEDRWITTGIAFNGVLLTVHHTYKQVDRNLAEIRIFSSRRATAAEKKQYQEV
jgi:uncharacterized DUF497 family protein